jgi:hypothetical protein
VIVTEKEFKDYHLVIELTMEEVETIYKELFENYNGTDTIMSTFFNHLSKFGSSSKK